MLCSSRTSGSRQSLWPAKSMALSVATCPVNALAQLYGLSLSCTVPSSESFSHTSPVFRSVTVPFPLSAYASGAPPRSSPSSPVPAHEMAFPLLSQHVVCPVAGSGQPPEVSRTARTGPMPFSSPAPTWPSWKSTNHMFRGLSASDVDVQVSPENVQLHVVTEQRSEEHTSELQSHSDLVCRLLLEKKKKKKIQNIKYEKKRENG